MFVLRGWLICITIYVLLGLIYILNQNCLCRIFDIRHKGYLDAFDLNFFFREIQEQLRQRGEEMVTFEDVKDEIYDMVSLCASYVRVCLYSTESDCRICRDGLPACYFLTIPSNFSTFQKGQTERVGKISHLPG